GRGGTILCADRRHGPPRMARAGAGDLFAGHPAGRRRGRAAGRLYRRGGGVAHRLLRGRHRRAGDRAGVPLAGARSAARRRDDGPRADRAGVRDPGGETRLLAAGVRRGGRVDVRLWRRLLAAQPGDAQLRADVGGDRAVHRCATAERRGGGHPAGRHAGRPAGRARPAL
ncbi:hypothetical protein LTR94_031650, partial [Friedmanniomyces endolithicus]